MRRRSFVEGVVGGSLALAQVGIAAGAGRTADPYALYLDVIRAWKRRDLEGVLARIDDDIVWYSRVGAPPIVGKADVRKALESIGSKRKEENWRVFFHAVNGNRLFVEGVDDYLDAQGRRVAVPYAGVTEFRDGRIVGWRDYFDIATLERQKAGEPIPEAIQSLVDRKGEP